MLDREVRDATTRVELARRDDRVGRTRIETTRAGATAVCVERRVGSEIDVDQQCTQEEVRTATRIHEHRVLADPAKPRSLCQVAFEYRAGVDVRLATDRRSRHGF